MNVGAITTTVGSSGGSATNQNYHPYQAVNFLICIQGIFPSRN